MGQLDAERRGKRPVEAKAEAEVVLQVLEIDVLRTGGDLAGVVEERNIEIAVDHDAPLRLEQQAVLVAEAPAAVAAQRRAAAERRQHEERNLLVVLLVRVLHPAVEREHPGLAQDREVRNRLVFDAIWKPKLSS